MISGSTRLAAVIGYPARHSKSPALHNAGFASAAIDAVYVAMTVAPDDLSAAITGLRAIGLLGASVTVPHKSAVMACCDSVTEAARTIGAVNTLEFRDDGTLVGHNTDALGFVRAFEEASGHRIAGRRVVLLGAGGAARAVDFGVRDAGAASVHVVARTPAKVSWTRARPWSEEALEELLVDCDLLIDCSSVGLSPETEAQVPAAIPLQHLPGTAIVSSLVYHRTTALLVAAQARGLQTIDGAGMLLHQGVLAFEIWTGVTAPVEPMRAALAAAT